MARLSAKLRTLDGGRVGYWCQGCNDLHAVRVQTSTDTPHPCWTWDGNVDAPTFIPSVLTTYKDLSGEGQHERCHTFIRGGMVEFLDDCTHQFAGQTLPLPNWPYAEGEYGGV